MSKTVNSSVLRFLKFNSSLKANAAHLVGIESKQNEFTIFIFLKALMNIFLFNIIFALKKSFVYLQTKNKKKTLP